MAGLMWGMPCLRPVTRRSCGGPFGGAYGILGSRYSFASPSACTPSALGRGSVSLLIINVAVLLIYARGLWEGDTVMQDRAVDILMGLRPERNSIVGLFESAGIRCGDAFTSQALIQLRRGYCEPEVPFLPHRLQVAGHEGQAIGHLSGLPELYVLLFVYLYESTYR